MAGKRGIHVTLSDETHVRLSHYKVDNRLRSLGDAVWYLLNQVEVITKEEDTGGEV